MIFRQFFFCVEGRRDYPDPCLDAFLRNSDSYQRGVVRAREAALLECGVVALSFFDVPFQPRFLLRVFTMRSSRLNDCAAELSSWLQEAGWHDLQTTAHCENAILPIDRFLTRASARIWA